jgi:hypothetical protein
MEWVKRNLFYVVGGAVSLILLGGAAWYYFSKAALLESINQSYEVATKEYQKYVADLAGADAEDPTAGIKLQEQAVSAKIEAAKQLLNTGRVVVPRATDDQEFKRELFTTISELQGRASNSGVVLPPDYQFSFSPQRKPLQFTTNCVDIWLVQLDDIRHLVGILLDAKVNKIEAIRRVPLNNTEDTKGSTVANEFLYGVSAITNAYSVNQPYEIAFRGFSGELAAVLDLLQKDTNFYVVKTVTVEPSHDVVGNFVEEAKEAAAKAAAKAAMDAAIRRAGGTIAPGEAPPQTAAQKFEARYGKNPGAAPVPLPPKINRVIAGSTNNLITVQYERPLHISLLIDVVKLKPTPGK